MKIFMCILQVLLALWIIMGGVYMIGNYSDLANQWALTVFPAFFWIIFGVIQIALSMVLLASITFGRVKKFAAPAAFTLAILSLLGLFIYSAYAGFPGVLWAIVPAALLGVIGYKQK